MVRQMSLIDDKWELLFDRYEIEKKVSESGLFYLTADQIREYKEPRLMTKFDTRESLPKVFGGRLGILPVTRGSYVIGNFDLYEEFPESSLKNPGVKRVGISDYYETIDIGDIRSEAGAINVMGIAGILDDFLEGSGFAQTVSGRMASGEFQFYVKSQSSQLLRPSRIEVKNSQVEIDGGFESRESFAVIEGKNVVHSNFLVRQLYYPYRLWEEKLRKQVRPVFLVYSNNIFRLMEYEFTDLFSYNSIRLVREKHYSLEDTDITMEALCGVWRQTEVKPEPNVTFIQADSFEKVISLVENLKDGPMTAVEIAELFGFRERQSDYYFNACRYLGLAAKERDEDGQIRVFLTKQGRGLLKLNYKSRQMEYVKLILEHQIFHDMFDLVLRTEEIPDKRAICRRMEELNLCSQSLIERRSSSVVGWLRWMMGLVE